MISSSKHIRLNDAGKFNHLKMFELITRENVAIKKFTSLK